MSLKQNKNILWFSEIGMDDVDMVGGKNASLGEMYSNLANKNINIPNGFAITAYAFRQFLILNKLEEKIEDLLEIVDRDDILNLEEVGEKIRSLIMRGKIQDELGEEIIKAFRKLADEENATVAVRSSATAEDLENASFAGQLESFLNIGEKQALGTVKKCFASLFTDRALVYSFDKKLDHTKINVSVGVQKMIRSDRASSGVIFTLDTETGFRDVVLINSAWGLGNNIVKGAVTPDQYFVFKPTLKSGYKPIIGKNLGSKKIKSVYSKNGSIKNLKNSKKEKLSYSLTDEEVLKLAGWAVEIEDYYKKPMDIEWAKDGSDGKLYIVQARPETIYKEKTSRVLEQYSLGERGEAILTGKAIGSKIGKGWVKILDNVREIDKFNGGEVLVTKMTDPDWVPIMKKASAIITESGGRTCHAAIVSRELGIPCVIGAVGARNVLKDGQGVTVSCAEGEEGKVYRGFIPVKIQKINLEKIKKPKTKIMMNVGEPEQAFSFSFIPSDGVGLVREEFIISNYIKIHPLAFLAERRDLSQRARKKMDELTFSYKNKADFFVDKLAEGVGKIAAAFYPKPVIVRFSDFKTNEYAGLVGGKNFEPEESNPMLGWRGASRYYDPKYQKAFLLECRAIKKVREEFGLDNIIVMVPFCRTVEEGKNVVAIIKKNTEDVKHNLESLKIYMMVEIPSNVIMAEEFAEIFDGFSIGSNDLTQLTLGVDRDSELVSHLFDERNEAVKRLIKETIRAAHKKKIPVGICGQAPSDFPDFAEFLVKNKIDSISLNPDSVLKTTLKILEAEGK
ncbi:phosphoenolpyruvate synthase [Candidatus Falkowbacteria bacterium RIFOXYB2_FULL_38_15]|uniref:Phosphoenolpyruvate synthase n=1 Tax=Candidatus Falkowbacteria bacterium RIFOXYA2_FULL_38_12 TaxID=1797993 RepID=A0A1F5S4F0_9BACT|nr:MAG: phosphoenolpyruvate synthase [Candidatus Falkowbacteria bacterium RIFOXYA2_FULL_38_12]OGF32725.1 MAG: phosphoenolpyruvate synthase [Candidatus Falkowbacteria bacterium RIFOXYB2_FULL_38_15]OGF42239.1 MAG: phosphoenolpyruvate synthase [Candidatus Falkowbacteria bacterium RIFOXYD2_FULL_39_16]